MIIRKLINTLNTTQKDKMKRLLYLLRMQYHNKYVKKYTAEQFRDFLCTRLRVKRGSNVLVHSSYDALLYWNLSPTNIVKIIADVVGDSGSITMPTFPTRHTHQYLKDYTCYDATSTTTVMGLIPEIFRIKNKMSRSLDPIRPFSVQGKNSEYLLKEHHQSIYSYDESSPLFKLSAIDGIVIGLGVPLQNLTLVHTIENILGNEYPTKVYDDTIHRLSVRDHYGNILTVEKKVLIEDTPSKDIGLFCRHIPEEIVSTFKLHFSSFFFCKVGEFLDHGVRLAKEGITIYNAK